MDRAFGVENHRRLRYPLLCHTHPKTRPKSASSKAYLDLPGPPEESRIMDQYPKIESIGSIGSIILAILEVQVVLGWGLDWGERIAPKVQKAAPPRAEQAHGCQDDVAEARELTGVRVTDPFP